MCPIASRSPTAPLIIPAAFANLTHGAQAWKLSLVKFDFTSLGFIPVYSPSLPDTAPGGRDFVSVATLSNLLDSILVVLPASHRQPPHSQIVVLPQTSAMQELNKPLGSL